MRHADKEKGSFYNSKLGHQDQPISRLGRLQAKRAAKYFRHKPLNAIYVSDYIRTSQTVKPLAKRQKLQLIPDSRLNEIEFGEIEKLTYDQVQSSYPELLKAYLEGTRDFRWPGGETGEEAQARVVSFFNEHCTCPGDKLIVTHDGIIRLLVCYLLQIPVYRRIAFKVATTGIMEIEREDDESQWTIVRLNQQMIE